MLMDASQFLVDQLVAVAVVKLPNGDFHTGLLYANGSQAKFLHMAEDLSVRSEAPKERYRWVVPGFDDSVKKAAAGMCSLIETSNPAVPYAFDREGWSFDANGHLVAGAPGKGMTCSTFILAAFDAISFPLLKEDQWPKGADQPEKLSILSKIFRGPRVESAHAELAMEDVSAPRIKPCQVAAASAENTFPVSYPVAKKKGEVLEKKIGKLDDAGSALRV